LVPSFLSSYTQAANLTGVSFRCPIPPCNPGVSCVLQGITCTCPCNSTGAGFCIPGSVACGCQSYSYGTLCTQQCIGTISTSMGLLPCSGHGICNNGPNGDGTCTCNVGYGGVDCSIPCPGAPNNTCSANRYCNPQGQCECFGNMGGLNCYGCAFGWAGPTCQIECRGGFKQPCSSNGDCNDGIGGDGNCICYSGWQGANCELVMEQQSSHVNPWLVFGIIIIILFVFALAVIIISVYFWYKTRKDYREIESKYSKEVADREIGEFRQQRLAEDKERTAIHSRKTAVDLEPI